jgi:hypothetical protein
MVSVTDPYSWPYSRFSRPVMDVCTCFINALSQLQKSDAIDCRTFLCCLCSIVTMSCLTLTLHQFTIFISFEWL